MEAMFTTVRLSPSPASRPYLPDDPPCMSAHLRAAGTAFVNALSMRGSGTDRSQASTALRHDTRGLKWCRSSGKDWQGTYDAG
ncbi:MAG TPA: hypothetical protein DCQ36_10365 [Actinobacteria bacterium]|nr:hypothetical protein [Actinomycetota bacterium]